MKCIVDLNHLANYRLRFSFETVTQLRFPVFSLANSQSKSRLASKFDHFRDKTHPPESEASRTIKHPQISAVHAQPLSVSPSLQIPGQSEDLEISLHRDFSKLLKEYRSHPFNAKLPRKFLFPHRSKEYT